MRKITLAILFILLTLSLFSEQVILGSGENSITVLTQSEAETILQYSIENFVKEPVVIDNATWYHVTLPKEGTTQEQGFPQLPVFNRSIVIPNLSAMDYQVYDIKYQDLILPVAPSKGVITRDTDPATVPYTFDPVYRGKGFYPEKIATLSDPYILRDFEE